MAWSKKARAAAYAARKKRRGGMRNRNAAIHLDANISEAKMYPKQVLARHNLNRAAKKRLGKDLVKRRKKK